MSRLLPPTITLVLAALNIAYITVYLIDNNILDGLAPIQRILVTGNAVAGLAWIWQAQSVEYRLGYRAGQAEARELERV